jgi:hypothetical protein
MTGEAESLGSHVAGLDVRGSCPFIRSLHSDQAGRLHAADLKSEAPVHHSAQWTLTTQRSARRLSLPGRSVQAAGSARNARGGHQTLLGRS